MNVSIMEKMIALLSCSLFFLLYSISVHAAQSYHSHDISTISQIDPLATRPPEFSNDGQGSAMYPLACTTTYDLPLTLEQAIDLALCHNAQIQGAWAAIKTQAASLGEARAAYLPAITASVSRMNDKTQYAAYHRFANTQTSIHSNSVYGSLNWRLLDFGGRNASHRAANALLKSALNTHEITLQKTLASVVSAYFDAQTAWAIWQGKLRNEALTKKIFASAQHRENKGVGSQSDTLQAMTTLTHTQLEKHRAQGAYQKTLALLVYILGLPPGTPVVLAEDLADQNRSLRHDLNQWLIETQKQHPALLSTYQQVTAAKEKVITTRSEGLPSLDLAANFYQNGRPGQSLTPNTKETLIGFTLNIPLFDGFSRMYKIRGAQAQVEQKEADLRDTKHQVLMEVVKAHADATTALENLDISKQYLENAQAALDSAQRKFDQGAADILIVLNAQTALSDARQERVRCLAEWRSAKFRLLASAGQLTRTNLGE